MKFWRVVINYLLNSREDEKNRDDGYKIQICICLIGWSIFYDLACTLTPHSPRLSLRKALKSDLDPSHGIKSILVIAKCNKFGLKTLFSLSSRICGNQLIKMANLL